MRKERVADDDGPEDPEDDEVVSVAKRRLSSRLGGVLRFSGGPRLHGRMDE